MRRGGEGRGGGGGVKEEEDEDSIGGTSPSLETKTLVWIVGLLEKSWSELASVRNTTQFTGRTCQGNLE